MKNITNRLQNAVTRLSELSGAEGMGEKEKKKLFRSVLLVSLVFLLAAGKGLSEKNKYILDEKGNVIGVTRADTGRLSTYSLIAEINGEYGQIRKKTEFTPDYTQPGGEKKKREEEKERGRKDAEARLNSTISDAENTLKKRIILPDRMDDGTRIKWTRNRKGGGWVFLYPAIIVMIVVYISREGSYRNRKREKELRKEVVLDLPRFTNQLMLMMNAGMILKDAFDQICLCYEKEEGSMSAFQKIAVEGHESNSGNRVSTAELINEMAEKCSSKELMRIASILRENERKGTDIIENLDYESRYLWDKRKIIAREQGKMMEMKMAYPLGLLLIVLMVVTMAPAMLEM